MGRQMRIACLDFKDEQACSDERKREREGRVQKVCSTIQDCLRETIISSSIRGESLHLGFSSERGANDHGKVCHSNLSAFDRILKLPCTTSPVRPPSRAALSTAATRLRGNQSATPITSDIQAKDQYERVRAIFAKYDMVFDDYTWPVKHESQAARVEKPIRMRVRIICHYCRTNYTASRECTNCLHRRCEKCTRIPPKRRSKGKGKERAFEKVADEEPQVSILQSAAAAVILRHEPADTAALSADDSEDEADVLPPPLNFVPKRPKRRKEFPLIIPSRTGGQDLIRKEPLQRVHRMCCKCQRDFVRDSNECPQCQHLRCIRCPRIPPKLDKWPNGYPDDVIPAEPESIPRQWKKPRIRVRWTCHECRKLFMEGENQCANCSHDRCSDCEREPPKREATSQR